MGGDAEEFEGGFVGHGSFKGIAGSLTCWMRACERTVQWRRPSVNFLVPPPPSPPPFFVLRKASGNKEM
jgi:hypothetical protein